MPIYHGYIPIEGQDNLVRDMFSMGVVNTDSAALARAKAEALEARKRKATVDTAMTEINTLRNEVSRLSGLVETLLTALQKKQEE